MNSAEIDPTTGTQASAEQTPRAALEAAFAAGEAALAAASTLAAAEAELAETEAAFTDFAIRAATSGAHAREPEASGSAVEAAPLVTTAPEAARALDAVLRDLRGDSRASEQQLEALLFSTPVPLTVAEIAAALRLTPEQTLQSLQRLEASILERPTAVALFSREKAGQRAFILDLKTAYRQDAAAVAPPMLKPVVTETLALIAMNQPLSQSRLVRERGTGVYDHVKELLARGLVQRRREGRNYLLRTTDAFAAEFGLDNDPELIRRALARAAGVQGAPEVVGSNRINWASLDPSTPTTDLVAEARAHVPPPPPPPAPTPSEAFFAAEVAPPPREDCVVSGGEPPVAEVVAEAPVAQAEVAAPAEVVGQTATTGEPEAPRRRKKKRAAEAEAEQATSPPGATSPAEAIAPTQIIEPAPVEVAAPAEVRPQVQEVSVSRPEEQTEKRETRVESSETADPKATGLLAMFQDQTTSDDW